MPSEKCRSTHECVAQTVHVRAVCAVYLGLGGGDFVKGSGAVRILRAPFLLVNLARQHRMRRRDEQQRHLLVVAGRED
eukprot:1508164-Pleurochrysis_carterae.AAC.1